MGFRERNRAGKCTGIRENRTLSLRDWQGRRAEANRKQRRTYVPTSSS